MIRDQVLPREFDPATSVKIMSWNVAGLRGTLKTRYDLGMRCRYILSTMLAGLTFLPPW
jgi:hypothetical protein